MKKENYWTKYSIPGCTAIHRIKKNTIFVSNANTVKHELSKCLGAILIHRYGDIIWDEEIIYYIKEIDAIVSEKYKDWPKNHSDFITEAQPNGERDRRVDLVNLKTNDRWEFESSKKIKKDNCFTIYI